MFRAKFFATAAAYCFTVNASLSISSAMASNEDLVWEIIDASGMVAGMEVAASEGLKAGIAPIAQQLEPLG